MKVIKSNDGWTVYCAKVQSGLNLNRYLFAIVPEKAYIGKESTLEQLDWVSFQTRSTEDAHDVPVYTFFLDDKRKRMLSDMITVIDRTVECTNYVTTNLPIKISLIHDKKKNNTLQYPDKAFLYQALETYNCVIEIL